ncbi:nodulation receptor kinase-like [Pyrus communis]|uniref:nodulation receptor kinase-like n=1 Tax=Pyrus communis TaxID=23211 RepID=UPI0035C0D01A
MMKKFEYWVLRLIEFSIICLFIFVPSTSADEGSFVSIACCAESNFTDSRNISWISDFNQFPNTTGCHTRVPSKADYSGYNRSRVFYQNSNQKRCYKLSTKKGEDYLIRATFLFGHIWSSSFSVSVGVTPIGVVDSSEDSAVVEGIFRATEDNTYLCLVYGKGTPYISEVELRPLQGLKYYLEDFPSSVLKLVTRSSFAITKDDISCSPMIFFGLVIFRYPYDTSDRIWKSHSGADPGTGTYHISQPNVSISGNATTSPPLQVLQTALAAPDQLLLLHNGLPTESYQYLVFLYFYEVDRTVQAGQRVFDIFLNDELKERRFDVSGNGSNYKELSFPVTANGSLNLTLVKVSGSENGPICNAYEILKVLPWRPETNKSDVEVILEVKNEVLKSNQESEVWEGWSGCPCLPVPWDGITCESVGGYAVITVLDLSLGIQRGGFLKGPVPSSITKLAHLRVLNLSHNDFTGNIPAFLPSSLLTSVDLSFNDLWGSLPISLISLPHLDILNISCNPHVAKDIPSSFNGSTLTMGQESCGAQEASNQRIIIGAAAASGSLLLTIVVGIIFYTWRRNYLPQGKFDMKQHHMTKNLIFSLPSMDDLVMKSISIETFTLEYIEAATQRYKTLIGEGGFGSVYRGTLIDGQEVAVKVRSATSTQGTREFENELNLLSAIRHENLVPLLGYCCENDQEILVYPFMSNGSLQDRLYGEAAKRKILDWPTRLSIALGAARGLTHLHNFAGRCIIHRDVKSSNILLDHSMTAKVADFGFSKYAPQEGDSCASLEVRGTAGYLDPEYYMTHHLSAKSDVFSFGVVLLEIVSGREPLNIQRPRPEWSLVEWAKPYVRESKIDEIVDPNIKGAYHAEAMWRVVEVALSCIEPFAASRPNMMEIVRELEDALIIENNASEYMRSIESSGSNRFSMVMERRIPPPTPSEPSSILSQMAPPEPR